jgi:hypothetical protein
LASSTPIETASVSPATNSVISPNSTRTSSRTGHRNGTYLCWSHPDGRRDDFIDPYFKQAKPDQVVAILKAREPGRILVANGNKKDDRWHLQMSQRWIIQYNFYLNDARWGRLFVACARTFLSQRGYA